MLIQMRGQLLGACFFLSMWVLGIELRLGLCQVPLPVEPSLQLHSPMFCSCNMWEFELLLIPPSPQNWDYEFILPFMSFLCGCLHSAHFTHPTLAILFWYIDYLEWFLIHKYSYLPQNDVLIYQVCFGMVTIFHFFSLRLFVSQVPVTICPRF